MILQFIMVKRYHVIMLSLYHFTMVKCYYGKVLSCYHVIMLSCYHAIMLSLYHFTMVKCYHGKVLLCYHAKVYYERGESFMVSRLTIYKKPAYVFSNSHIGIKFKIRGGFRKWGPEFNFNARCALCPHLHQCPWIDRMDCLDASINKWFGHLDIGRILD